MKKIVLALALLGWPCGAISQAPLAPPRVLTVQFSDDEIKAAIQMIDECVKAKGLLCAEPALVITRKLRAAQDQKNP